MKQVANNFKTAFGCWGVHVGLTILLALLLVAYDGLEDTYGIVIGYMWVGWIIPFAFWRLFKTERVNSVGKIAEIAIVPTVLLSLGTLLFICAIFVSGDFVSKIVLNGQTITKLDPRFTEVLQKVRIVTGALGLFFAAFGYVLRRRRKLKN